MDSGCIIIDAASIASNVILDPKYIGQELTPLTGEILQEINKQIRSKMVGKNLSKESADSLYEDSAQQIYDTLEMFGVEWESTDYQDSKAVLDYLKNSEQNNVPANDDTPSKEDAVSDPNGVSAPRRRKFITKYYHTSTGAIHMMRLMFYNGMKVATMTGKQQFITSRDGINTGIRDFQENLLATLCDYVINKHQGQDDYSDVYEKWGLATLYKISENSYEGEQRFVYTNVIEELEQLPEIQELLKIDTNLNNVYRLYDTNPDQKIALDAYNAYFILKHFDDLLNEEIPEIEIVGCKGRYDISIIRDGLKYKFGRMSHTSTNWRDDNKDFDAAKELPKPLQMIIETSNIYQRGTNIKKAKETLTLRDFNRIVSTLKKIACSKWALDQFKGKVKEAVDNICKGKNYNSFFELIGDLNNDPAINYGNLFKLLSSDAFLESGYFVKNVGSTGRTKESVNIQERDLDLIWSIYKLVFERHNLEQINNWQEWSLLDKFIYNPDPNLRENYFNYLIEAFSTIESFQLQQYREIDNGSIVNQTLRDNVNISSRRQLENIITSNLSSLLPRDLSASLSRFKQDSRTQSLDDFIKYQDDTNEYVVVFKVGDFTITVRPSEESLTGGHVTIVRNSINKTVKDSQTNESDVINNTDLNSLRGFINTALEPLDIFNIEEMNQDDSTSIFKLFLSYEGQNTGMYQLTCLSASILANAVLQAKLKEDINSEEINSFDDYKDNVRTYYKFNSPPIDKSSMEFLTLVSETFIHTLVDLDIANKVYHGIYGDNSVRDSQGKTISQVGVSMLTTKLENQLFTQNKSPKSASRHFMLWNTPHLFRDIQFTREFAGFEDQKVGTQFNTAEQLTSQFVYDFIGGLLVDDKVRQRFVSIMPSIISDKSRILKIILDFKNSEIFFNGDRRNLSSLSAEEWKGLANQSLGQFYVSIWQNTLQTFNKLSEFTKANYTLADGTPLIVSPADNFSTFNKWAKEQNKSAEDALHDVVLAYQKTHNDNLEIVQEMQYTFEGKQMVANRLIVSQIYRASNQGLINLRNVATEASILEELKDFEDYLKSKGKELFGPSGIQLETAELLQEAQNYRDDTGNIILLNKYFTFTGKYVSLIGSSSYTYTESLDSILGSWWLEEIRDPENIKNGRYITNEEFWRIKNSDLIKDILNLHEPIKTTKPDGSTIKSPEFQKLATYRRNGVTEKWVASGTGNVILAKLIKVDPETKKETARSITSIEDIPDIGYNKNGKYIRVDDESFNFYEYLENCNGRYQRFELNPYLDTWNASNYLLSQEFMNSTVGSHLNHPSKKLKKVGSALSDLEEEAERWMAQVKRNVSLTATKHSFALNLLNGIRDTYRIAVVKDLKAEVFNIQGQYDEFGATIHDGSTVVCGANNYLENNSLGGSRAGVDKKQFIHSYKEETGDGDIIKTAGFAITNSRIRRSAFLEMLNYKMMRGKWTTKDGKAFVPDITKNFYGETISYEPIIFKDLTGDFFRVDKIIYEGDGQYKRLVVKVDPNTGEDIGKVEDDFFYPYIETDQGYIYPEDNNVDNNYALWQLFGGKNTYEVQVNDITKERKLVPSESSFRNLVKAMNNISEQPFSKSKPPASQTEVYQNLKYSNIDYIVTEGAIKQGAANVNSNKVYTDIDYEFTTMNIRMHDSGIQLDAEHEADDSTISLMTQVVNALCARGYTLEECEDVYEAMLELTRVSISDYIDGLSEYFSSVDEETGQPTGDPTKLKDALASTIVKALSNASDRDGNLLQAISETVVQEAKEGKRITAKNLAIYVPADHPAVFNQLSSAISSALTRKGIRIKFNGSLAVLNPSHGIYTLNGNRMRGELTRQQLQELQAQQQPINKAEMLMGHRYLVKLKSGETIKYFNSNPFVYWQFMEEHSYDVEEVVEDVITPRDLSTYQFNFQSIDGEYFNQWDLDVVKALYIVQAHKEAFNNIGNLRAVQDVLLGKEDIAEYIRTHFDIRDQSQFMEEGVFSLYKFRQYVNQNFHINSYILEQLDLEGIQDTKGLIRRLKRIEQKTLDAVSSGKQDIVYINGSEVRVDKNSLKVHDYEAIMPKIYATDLGLEVGDAIADIFEQKSGFFLQKLLKRWYSIVNDKNFDVELKRIDGKHLYILDRKNGIPQGLKLDQYATDSKGYEGNKLYRFDAQGNPLYKMYNENDQIYVDAAGHEVIVTDSPKFYINSEKFNNIRLSDKVITDDAQFNAYLNLLAPEEDGKRVVMDNEVVRSYMDIINYDKNEALTYNRYHRRSDISEADLQAQAKSKNTPKYLKQLVRNANEMYASFDQSLNTIAGRIPAQSMQSFMAMRIIGFDDTNLNSVYVNYWQIWLQGSDFDIDKVSLLGFNFGKDGKFIGWSNLFNISTIDHLKASLELPYPKRNMHLQIETIDETQMSSDMYELRKQDFYTIMDDIDNLKEILREDGDYKHSMSPDEIKKTARIIRILNRNKGVLYVPKRWIEGITVQNLEGRTMQVVKVDRLKALKKLYNSHNDYIKQEGHSKQAIMNFITSYMFTVSRNPRNLMQSQSSVDDLTKLFKELAATSPQDKRIVRYAPGNVMSKLETLILTLTGKENVGIVASAMKTFEALSFYYYKNMRDCAIAQAREDSDKVNEISRKLLFKPGQGKKICGRVVNLLANTYTDEDTSNLPDNIREAYEAVDNDYDAFLLISALLSLATDNAKDPTLAKLNAGPDMMGLYTAGIAIGLDVETLVGTMMSDTGTTLTRLLGGNIFNGNPKRRLNKALDYVRRGPDLKLAPKTAIDRLSTATKFIVGQLVEDGYDLTHILGKQLSQSLADSVKQSPVTQEDWDSMNMQGNFEEFVFKAKVKQAFESGNLSKTQLQTLFNNLVKKGVIYKDKTSRKTLSILTDIIVTAIKSQSNDISGLSEKWSEVKKLKEEAKEKLGENATEEEITQRIATQLQSQDIAINIQGNTTKLVQEKMYLNNLLQEYKSFSLMYQNMQCDYLIAGGKSIKLAKFNKDGFYQRLREKKDCHRVGDWYAVKETDEEGNVQVVGAVQLLNAFNKDEIDEFYKLPYEERKGQTPPTLINPEWSPIIPVYKAWDAISDLNEVNTEMGRIREKLALNQGMPNKFADQLSAIIKFRSTITDRAQEIIDSNSYSDEDKETARNLIEKYSSGLDLHKFLYNAEYQKQAIEDYNSIKCVFNVLAVVIETPHYRGYLEALDAMFVSQQVNSLIYRKVNQETPKICEAFGYKGSKKIADVAKHLQKFFEYKLNNIFLRTSNLSVVISKGSYLYNDLRALEQVTKPTPIELGTETGNASFKRWVEQEVIPNMKKGINNKRVENPDGTINPNADFVHTYTPAFIKHLVPVKNKKTQSGNAIVSYSLPISTMPRSEQEKIRFEQYKQEFTTLESTRYYYQYIDENGNLRQDSIAMQDILFLYNLIVYGNEQNQRSLTGIFEAVIRDGSLDIYAKYIEFLAQFGQYQNLDENLDYSRLEEIEWCAPMDNPLTSKLPFIRAFDPVSMRYVLLRREDSKNQDISNEDFGEDIMGDTYGDNSEFEGDDYAYDENGDIVPTGGGNSEINLNDTPYRPVFAQDIDENFFLYNVQMGDTESGQKPKLFLNGNAHIRYDMSKDGSALIIQQIYIPNKSQKRNTFTIQEASAHYWIQLKNLAKERATVEGELNQEVYEQLLEEYSKRVPKKEDFTIMNIATSVDNVNTQIPNREQIQALVDELFNMCP